MIGPVGMHTRETCVQRKPNISIEILGHRAFALYAPRSRKPSTKP